jgi:hypothetical protein
VNSKYKQNKTNKKNNILWYPIYYKNCRSKDYNKKSSCPSHAEKFALWEKVWMGMKFEKGITWKFIKKNIQIRHFKKFWAKYSAGNKLLVQICNTPCDIPIMLWQDKVLGRQ